MPSSAQMFQMSFFPDVIDLNQTKKHHTFVLCIDFHKAHFADHISLKNVKCSGFWNTCFECNFALLQNSETAVIANEFNVIFFPVKKGVRQGDPISLHLCFVFSEPMFWSITSNNLRDGVFISFQSQTLLSRNVLLS